MPRLSDLAVRTATPREKPFRLSDGNGLLLEVRPTGSRQWVLRYMREGRRRDMGLGAHPLMSLAQARRAAQQARALAREGSDPIDARIGSRKAADEAKRAAARAEVIARSNTFRAVAERLIQAQSPGWTSQTTHASWRWTMDSYAYPHLGDRPVAEITRDEVLAVLLPLKRTRPATAQKLHRRISAVLDLAIQLGFRTLPNTATPRAMRLVKALPEPPRSFSQPSLPWDRVPAFLTALNRMEGVAAKALRFAILTGVRSAEVRGARWSELDVAARLWTIPAQRMKGGKARAIPQHRVPLTPAMLNTLAQVAALRTGEPVAANNLAALVKLLGGATVFPNSEGKPFSDAALSAVIKRMNGARPKDTPLPWTDPDTGRGVVPHGFRRSFRNWVSDNHPADAEAAEKALAHYPERGTASGAYRSSDLLPTRVKLMALWCDFATETEGRTARSTAAT